MCELSFTLKLELVDRMASISESAVAAERDANIVVPQVFVEGNYLGVSDGRSEPSGNSSKAIRELYEDGSH